MLLRLAGMAVLVLGIVATLGRLQDTLGQEPVRNETHDWLLDSTTPAQAMDLPAQTTMLQKITIEFTATEAVSVYVFMESDAKSDDMLLTADPSKALGGKKESKGDTFTVEIPVNTPTRVVVRWGGKRADVKITVSNVEALTKRIEDLEKELVKVRTDFRDLRKRKIVKAAYDAASLGTELYNKKNYEGCFRLYQGTLQSIQPLIPDDQPKLVSSVKGKMEDARNQPPAEGAYTLRRALDEIMNELGVQVKVQSALWDRLGELEATKMVDYVVARARSDDSKVKTFRDIKKADEPTLKSNLMAYVSSITGGPNKYTAMDAKTAFAGMKLSDDEFDALAGIFEEALKKQKVDPKDIQEFMKLLKNTRPEIVKPKG